jgi:hypothetical protein
MGMALAQLPRSLDHNYLCGIPLDPNHYFEASTTPLCHVVAGGTTVENKKLMKTTAAQTGKICSSVQETVEVGLARSFC